MSKLIFVTGGRRSGKSAYALELAESLGNRRLYIATAESLDDEMKERIARHRAERGEGWETIEEPVDVAGVVRPGGTVPIIRPSGRKWESPPSSEGYDVILIDCLTLWLCNVMHTNIPSHHRRGGDFSDDEILKMIDALAAACRKSLIPVTAVTNELGLGVIPGDPLSRRYTDLVGIMNQRMAAAADRVVMVVSGIPMTLKDRA